MTDKTKPRPVIQGKLDKIAADEQSFGFVHMGAAAVTDDEVFALIEALQTNTTAHTLLLDKNLITDEGAIAIAEYCKSNPAIRRVKLDGNKLTTASYDAFASVIQSNPNMLSIILDATDEVIKGTPTAEALERAVNQNPNMLSFRPESAATIQHCNYNAEQALMLGACLKDKDLDELSPLTLCDVIVRLPSIETELDDDQTGRVHDELLRLPRIRGETPQTIDVLFEPNKRGFTPLDNPLSWDNPQAVFDRLGDLTDPQFSERETPNGFAPFDYMVMFADLEKAMPILRQQGINLRADILLEDKEPSEYLKILSERRQLAHLFTEENWKGASPAELRAVHEALPEGAEAQISNYHQLLNTLRTSETERNTNQGRA